MTGCIIDDFVELQKGREPPYCHPSAFSKTVQTALVSVMDELKSLGYVWTTDTYVIYWKAP